jgi:hypothetical protein
MFGCYELRQVHTLPRVESPAELQKRGDQWIATAKLPEGTTACFMNVKANDLTASSDFAELNGNQ